MTIGAWVQMAKELGKRENDYDFFYEEKSEL
jgi:hypothetical protein